MRVGKAEKERDRKRWRRPKDYLPLTFFLGVRVKMAHRQAKSKPSGMLLPQRFVQLTKSATLATKSRPRLSYTAVHEKECHCCWCGLSLSIAERRLPFIVTLTYAAVSRPNFCIVPDLI